MKAVTVTGGSSDDPKSEGTTVTGEEPEKAASPAAADTETGTEAEDSTGSPGSSEPGPTETKKQEDARPAAETEEEAEPGAEAGSRPEGEVEGADAAPESEARAAQTESEPPTAPDTDTDTPDSDPKAEHETDAEDPRSRVLRAPGTTTPGARAPEPKESATSEPEPEPEADAKDSRTQVLRVPEPKATATPKPGAEAEPEAENSRTQVLRVPGTAAPEPKKTAEPAPEAGAAAKQEPEPRAEAEATDSRTQILRVPGAATPGAKAPAEPEAQAKNKAEDEDEAKDSRTQVLRVPEPKATATPKPGAEAGPEAGNSRTQVLRVPKPETTATPKPKPEAEGGSGRVSGTATPVSKKTAEPKPTSPPEDAARKVPSWAAARNENSDPDPDPERTSRFVALKDPDAAPPATARPQPQARPQAPVPQPLPPLDLLAELTNTPAPVETPRRTVLRRVKVWTPILLLLVGACIGGQMLRPLPDPRLVSAETEHTVDGQVAIPWPAKGQGAVRVVGSGDVATFGEQKPVPTASVAKIMTAYVILKNHPLRKAEPGPSITVDAKTVADGTSEHESRITGLTAGSKFSQHDMLKMLMIPSGNNVARLLARWDTGTDSEAAFVEKMNAAARELGMKDTTYTDPSGLDAGTVSTASDQLRLAEAVMKDDAFRAIVALPEAPVKGLGEKLVNNNHLLTDSNLSIRGIKTGSSTPAGGTFVWAAYKTIDNKDQLIIGSLMEQRAPAPDENALKSLELVKANSKKIIESVRTALASTPLVRKGDIVGYVDDGLGGRTPLVAVKDLNVISVPGQQFKLSLKPGASPLPHTAKDGAEVGVLTAGEGEGARSVPVAVKGALAEPSFGTRLTRLG
ncbi:D-alanyl-D-alanine carboxypeptidase family protein [Streptomyces yangpuensis]|uniref:D-alanyl-D-alanine carboxypeptidase family protein n=1 Tax=Streptomyces yangpuensis TaxID=1648182 RepID=UPI000A6B7F5C|nr:serine hydrolase [Streptomyces yangpuensis]